MLPAPLALVVTLIVAVAWMRFNQTMAARGWTTSWVSRKLIHTGTGPLYVLTWLLYPTDAAVRAWAVWVPLVLTLNIAAVGFGLRRDSDMVQSMARTGHPRELLRGPLLYGLVFVALTVLLGRTSPLAVAALMMLCGGDGLAELAGRAWGQHKLPWSRSKSWVGSLAFFVGGAALTLLVIAVYTHVGLWPGPWRAYWAPTLGVAAAATLAESLPWPEVDNLVVPLVAYGVGLLLPWP